MPQYLSTHHTHYTSRRSHPHDKTFHLQAVTNLSRLSDSFDEQEREVNSSFQDKNVVQLHLGNHLRSNTPLSAFEMNEKHLPSNLTTALMLFFWFIWWLVEVPLV